MATTSAPLALRIVAILFVLGGISAVIEVLAALAQNRLYLNVGVLGLFIGPGLLRFSRGWRTCALIFLWIGLIVIPFFVLVLLGSASPPEFRLFGLAIGHAPRPVALAVAAAMFALLAWQYRVLTRPDIRRLFGLPGDLPSGPRSADSR